VYTVHFPKDPVYGQGENKHRMGQFRSKTGQNSCFGQFWDLLLAQGE